MARAGARLGTAVAATAALVATVLAAGAGPAAAADGKVTTFTDPGGDASTSSPAGITSGPDGNLWYASSATNRIGRITPDGTITTFADPLGSASTNEPIGIAAGPDGNLWYTSFNTDRIGRIDPDAVDPGQSIVTFADPGGSASTDQPWAITAGPDGNLWYTSIGSDRIGRITPAGTITTFADPAGSASTDGPREITLGPDGNLWYTSFNNDRIGRITPDGTITTFADPAGTTSTNGPRGITLGPDGNLWYTSSGNDRIGRITPDGTITTFADPAGTTSTNAPVDITAGADGNLWYTSYNNDRIGRITPDGTITTYTDPGGNTSNPVDIAAGPDGNLWYSSQSNDRIGRLVPVTIEVDPADGLVGGQSVAVSVTGLDADEEASVVECRAELGGAASCDPDTMMAIQADGDGTAQASFEVHSYLTTPDGEHFCYPDECTLAVADSVAARDDTAAITFTTTFSDVADGHPFFEDIEWMADAGISTGYDGGTYQPAAPVTRQAMSAFMYRLAGEPAFEDPADPTFVDVSDAHPFFHEIEWMADEGISTGHDDGTYQPAAPVTRQAMSAFMHRLANGPGVGIED